MKNVFYFAVQCPALSQAFGGSCTDRSLPDAQSNLGLWGDGKGEDELSPEEIQMVSVSGITGHFIIFSAASICIQIHPSSFTTSILCRIMPQQDMPLYMASWFFWELLIYKVAKYLHAAMTLIPTIFSAIGSAL